MAVRAQGQGDEADKAKQHLRVLVAACARVRGIDGPRSSTGWLDATGSKRVSVAELTELVERLGLAVDGVLVASQASAATLLASLILRELVADARLEDGRLLAQLLVDRAIAELSLVMRRRAAVDWAVDNAARSRRSGVIVWAEIWPGRRWSAQAHADLLYRVQRLDRGTFWASIARGVFTVEHLGHDYVDEAAAKAACAKHARTKQGARR